MRNFIDVATTARNSSLGLCTIFSLREDVCQSTATTVLTIVVHGHKDTSTASLVGTFTTKSSDFAIIIHLVVFPAREMDYYADIWQGVSL